MSLWVVFAHALYNEKPVNFISSLLLVRAALGNHSAAVEDYKLVLEEQPQHREAQSKLAAALPLTHEPSCTR